MSPAEPPMIRVSNLTKSYGPLQAVAGLSFAVPRGSILGLLGPNGAGKTTTMKILTGHLSRDGGTVLVGGQDPEQDPLGVKARLGYLPEHTPLYLEMFVDEYLAFAARAKNTPGTSQAIRRAQVDQAVAQCGLETVFRRRIGNLSKGFRQRVGLAQALIGDPAVLILDEPTIGLDPSQIVDIRRVIKSLAGQKTVILSSHILPEVSQTCDEVVIIARGRLVAQGSPSGLADEADRGLELELELAGDGAAAVNVFNSLPGLAFSSPEARPGWWRLKTDPGQDPRSELVRRLVAAGLEVRQLRAVRPSLEQIFVSLVAGESGSGPLKQERPQKAEGPADG